MRNVLVVGGAGGVGHPLVGLLLQRGDTVTVTVLNATEADHIRKAYGTAVTVHEVDLSNAEAARALFEPIVAAMGRVDAVAHCAGILDTCPVEVTPISMYQRMYEINCLSAVALFQVCAPALRKSKGRIVVISSTAGRVASPFVGAYVVSKFALEALADVVRRETFGQGISFSLVEPGFIRTSMSFNQLATCRARRAALSQEHQKLYGHFYDSYERYASQSMDTNAASPEEVAKSILEVMDTANPQPRYVVGEQAKGMLAAMENLPDYELDKFMHEMHLKSSSS
jgi:NAD(P)-dependent dehydrogenase (short-subunit alcohol dehydrogenase family)